VTVGAMMMWPAAATLGFVVMTALVVVLGTGSTARYEFERNGATAPSPAAAAPIGNHPAGRRAPARLRSDAAEQAEPQAVTLAVRPAPAGAPAWWLVGESAQVMAGPFDDRIDADWAALAGELHAVAAYGAVRSDGSLAPRPSPQDRAWLVELGDQLDRLPEDWDALLSDTDPLTTLVVEVAAALVEAGLPLYDAAQGRPAGGVSLVPETGCSGLLVSWRTHDRMSVHGSRGPEADAAVQQLMNASLADVLTQLGFVVQPFGDTGCILVTALR